MKQWIKNNGLSLTFFSLFIIAITGQIFTGWKEFNKEQSELNQPSQPISSYLHSGHFLQATFENWESEFLQMALFVLLTIFLRQKGSSESKKMDGPEEVDREPSHRNKDAPYPVRKGGWMLAVYKHSLTIALVILFIVSFAAHLYGSLKDENDQLLKNGLHQITLGKYLGEPRFWFESFQNWQSEFLSVFAIVILSIFLRQKGSSQSKPVDAPNSQTGSE